MNIAQRERPAASKVEINLQQSKSLSCTCQLKWYTALPRLPNFNRPYSSVDKVTLNSGYIDTYWAGARTLGDLSR